MCAKNFMNANGAHAEEQSGDDGGEKTSAAGGGEPIEIVARGFGSRLGYYWSGTRNRIVEIGTSHPGAPGRTLPSGRTTLNAGVVAWLIASFTVGNPQRSTSTERMRERHPSFCDLSGGIAYECCQAVEFRGFPFCSKLIG